MHEPEEERSGHLLNDLLIGSELDAHEIVKALENSIELGFINWGEHRDMIMKLITDPEPSDLVLLITKSETVLKPLEEWMLMERKVNYLRKGTISKYDYYATEYRCSQIQNFILLLKLY